MKRGVLLCAMVGSVLGTSMLMAQDAPKAGKREHKERAAGEQREKGAGERKEKAPEAALQDLTLTGKITKEDHQKKDGTTESRYILTDATGTQAYLPGAKMGKGGAAPAVNLGDYLNVDVKVVAKGVEKEMKGKKAFLVKEIVSIEKLAAPAM